jgi:hypothetical protein
MPDVKQLGGLTMIESSALRMTKFPLNHGATARENFDISPLPQDALDEINRIQTRQRLNTVVKTGIPGFIPRGA